MDPDVHTGHKGDLSFLTKKIGPLPLGVWIIAAVGIWWYISKHNAAKSTGSQTDPAGNVGTIDPATGFVYGSPEDLAALSAANPVGGIGTNSPAPSGFTSNDQWKAAALGDLVQNGVPVGAATQAIDDYLSGQTPTTTEQGYIDTAITDIGPPPFPPGTVSTGTSSGGTTPPPTTGGDKDSDDGGGPISKPPSKEPLPLNTPVKVPNVVGQKVGTAEATLNSAGFKSDPGKDYNATSIVTSTSPVAGSSAKTGSTVTLHLKTTVSTGKPPSKEPPPLKTVKVPHVTGMKVGAAEGALTSAGLTYDAGKNYNDTSTVTATSPAAGATVRQGTSVKLTLHTPPSRPGAAPRQGPRPGSVTVNTPKPASPSPRAVPQAPRKISQPVPVARENTPPQVRSTSPPPPSATPIGVL